MARRSPFVCSHTSRRGMIAGALAIALTATAVPVLSGCKAVPYLVHTVVSWCLPVLAKVFDDPVSSLPAGYTECGRHKWAVRGEEVRFCVFCSSDPAKPVLIQLNCTGDFYPVKLRDGGGHGTSTTGHLDGESGLGKISCDEYILSVAQAASDEFRSRADASIIAPNTRLLPSVRPYDDLIVEVDGAPAYPDGSSEVQAGDAVRIRGSFDQVARYAAEAGVRSIEFRDGGDAWAVELNPEFSAVAIFRNARLVEARFLFAPPRLAP